MSKVQLNVRVAPALSSRVKRDAESMPFTNDEIVGSIIANFFRSTRKAKRLEIYREFRSRSWKKRAAGALRFDGAPAGLTS